MDTVVVNTERSGLRMSWGAIFGGAIVTIGLWMLLHTLGLAAGLTAIDPRDQGSLRAIGIGTGVWSVIAPLIALFAGGFVAAYMGRPGDRASGAMQGVVLWGLTTIMGVVLVAIAVASTVRAGVQAGMAAVSGGAAAGAMVDLQDLGLQADDLLAPVNQRITQQGGSPVTAQQLEAATSDLLQRAVRQGDLDRAAVVTALAQNTAMTRDEAQQIAARVASEFDRRASELRQSALVAADRTGKALWGVFLALLLGLVAAAGGAAIGSGTRAARAGEERAPTAPPVPPRHVPVQSTT